MGFKRGAVKRTEGGGDILPICTMIDRGVKTGVEGMFLVRDLVDQTSIYTRADRAR